MTLISREAVLAAIRDWYEAHGGDYVCDVSKLAEGIKALPPFEPDVEAAADALNPDEPESPTTQAHARAILAAGLGGK